MVNNKFSKLFYQGAFWGEFSVLMLVSLTYFFYPNYKKQTTNFNYLVSKGMVGSKLVNKAFYRNITNNDGIAIFGTSESGSLATRFKAQNYWHSLGQSFGHEPFIHTTAGAGNSPYMWLSNICNFAENSRVYYIVNPIYFTNALNSTQSILSYKDRYLSQDTYKNLNRCANEHLSKGLYNKFNSIFLDQGFNPMTFRSEMAFFINEAYDTFLDRQHEFEGGNAQFEKIEEFDPDWSENYNVANWIVEERNNRGFAKYEISNDFFSSVRFIELLAAKEIANALKIDLRFILLPPNYIFFEKFDSNYPEQFKQIIGGLKDKICDKDNCIDLTSEANAKGLFIDAMHFSAFGGNAIADALIHDIRSFFTDQN